VLTVLPARELRLLWPGSRRASSREALVLVAAGLHVTRLTGNLAAAHTGEDVETCLNGFGEEAVWVTYVVTGGTGGTGASDDLRLAAGQSAVGASAAHRR
jgi:hypothetical protein